MDIGETEFFLVDGCARKEVRVGVGVGEEIPAVEEEGSDEGGKTGDGQWQWQEGEKLELGWIHDFAGRRCWAMGFGDECVRDGVKETWERKDGKL